METFTISSFINIVIFENAQKSKRYLQHKVHKFRNFS
jgi:hypothetical protein